MAERGEFKPGSKPKWFWLGDEPHKPWPVRLRALCVWVAAPGWFRHNASARRTQRDRDLQRAIREGFLSVTPRGYGLNPRAKGVVLTDTGRALIAAPTLPTHRPYAKRRRALAEFYEVNSHD